MNAVKRSAKAVKAADESELRQKQARRAYELRQEGKSWWAIAEELKISESLAMSRVDQAISEAARLVEEHSKRSLLALEVGRLDRIQEAFWPTAIGGDIRAAELILKVSAQRSKLLGLDSVGQSTQAIHTVIVQGNSQEYVEALRMASDRKAIEA